MIVKELQVLVDQKRNKQYNQAFISTGGTCLRHCFDMNRLSEDLDFDVKTTIDIEEFKEALENYFKKNTYIPLFRYLFGNEFGKSC